MSKKIKKNEMVFQSVDSLQQVVNVVNEAAAAVNDKSRTIRERAIPEVLAGTVGGASYKLNKFVLVNCDVFEEYLETFRIKE